ncbi:hypothetical protein FNV43_RR19467 [Rhamnella rubrinervis]|uniref:Uncharacterized protein n=1 Tax=Rhamnella rubrinervis TaxID=2594499 RepID=A0A8K0GWA4_9ROSA|nr:hypothetical protein FNV43_RR19467 [Rhamnella rubrinervis]
MAMGVVILMFGGENMTVTGQMGCRGDMQGLLTQCAVTGWWFASQEVVDFIKGKKLNDRPLKKLKIMLLSANIKWSMMLRRSRSEIQQSNNGLMSSKQLTFDAEDLAYQINTEAL